MKTYDVDADRAEAKRLVKAALDRTDGITQYLDEGDRITAKTGSRLGLIVGSYGEVLTITFEDAVAGRLGIRVESEPEYNWNFTAKPDRYENRFRDAFERVRERGVSDGSRVGRKEVASRADLYSGSSGLLKIVAMMVGAFLLGLLLLAVIAP